MSLAPLSIRDLEQRTKNVYEAVVVMAQRSKQIIHQRLVDKALDEEGTEELSALDPIPEEKDPDEYIEMEKPTTIAIDEFMADKVKWHYVDKIEV